MSKQLSPAERKKFEILLTKALDDELNTNEKGTFEKYLSDYDGCRIEWLEFKQLKEVTKDMKLKSPATETWDYYWVSVYNRLERGVAWTLLSIGFIIIFAYSGIKAIEALITDPGIGAIEKIGIQLLVLGLAILIVSVVREKLKVRKSDPYKEVRR